MNNRKKLLALTIALTVFLCQAMPAVAATKSVGGTEVGKLVTGSGDSDILVADSTDTTMSVVQSIESTDSSFTLTNIRTNLVLGNGEYGALDSDLGRNITHLTVLSDEIVLSDSALKSSNVSTLDLKCKIVTFNEKSFEGTDGLTVNLPLISKSANIIVPGFANGGAGTEKVVLVVSTDTTDEDLIAIAIKLQAANFKGTIIRAAKDAPTDGSQDVTSRVIAIKADIDMSDIALQSDDVKEMDLICSSVTFNGDTFANTDGLTINLPNITAGDQIQTPTFDNEGANTEKVTLVVGADTADEDLLAIRQKLNDANFQGVLVRAPKAVSESPMEDEDGQEEIPRLTAIGNEIDLSDNALQSGDIQEMDLYCNSVIFNSKSFAETYGLTINLSNITTGDQITVEKFDNQGANTESVVLILNENTTDEDLQAIKEKLNDADFMGTIVRPAPAYDGEGEIPHLVAFGNYIDLSDNALQSNGVKEMDLICNGVIFNSHSFANTDGLTINLPNISSEEQIGVAEFDDQNTFTENVTLVLSENTTDEDLFTIRQKLDMAFFGGTIVRTSKVLSDASTDGGPEEITRFTALGNIIELGDNGFPSEGFNEMDLVCNGVVFNGSSFANTDGLTINLPSITTADQFTVEGFDDQGANTEKVVLVVSEDMSDEELQTLREMMANKNFKGTIVRTIADVGNTPWDNYYDGQGGDTDGDGQGGDTDGDGQGGDTDGDGQGGDADDDGQGGDADDDGQGGNTDGDGQGGDADDNGQGGDADDDGQGGDADIANGVEKPSVFIDAPAEKGIAVPEIAVPEIPVRK